MALFNELVKNGFIWKSYYKPLKRNFSQSLTSV